MTAPHTAAARTGAGLEPVLREHERPGGAWHPRRLAADDAAERYPDAACRVLDDAGLPAWYVPTRHGGALDTVPGLVDVLRRVARRDLTVAIGHGKTFLGAISVWVAGSDEQRARLAADILAGAPVSWALTEREHGGDLLAGELTATAVEAGWRLDGEKWLINNATRSPLLCVLARTDPTGGPRGFSVALVDKRRLAPGTYRCLPKIHTHGIRGADISGIAFHGAVVGPGDLVGPPGSGVETVLKSLQLTRTVCCALSLGAADAAAELALDHARGQRRFGHRILDLPSQRAVLGEVLATRRLAEAVAAVAARTAHAAPAELPVVSAIAKALVPALVDGLLDTVAGLLGVRGYLDGGPEGGTDDGRFARLYRDHRIVGIFDGSTVVNRNVLVNHFPVLVRHYARRTFDPAQVALAADDRAALPELDLTRLRLLASPGAGMVQALPAAVRATRDRADGGDPAAARLAPLADRLAETTEALHTTMAAIAPEARDVPADAFAAAARYELCYAGAAVLHRWLHHPQGAGPAALAAEAALTRALVLLGHDLDPDDVYERLLAEREPAS